MTSIYKQKNPTVGLPWGFIFLQFMIQFRQAKKSNGDFTKLTKKTPRWLDLGVFICLYS